MPNYFGITQGINYGFVHDDPIEAPDLALQACDGAINVTVTSPLPGATEYLLYVGTAPGAEDTSPAATSATPQFELDSLTNGTTYYMVATAVVGGIESLRSQEQSATPQEIQTLPSVEVGETLDGFAIAIWPAQAGMSYVLSQDGAPIWGGPGYDDGSLLQVVTNVPVTAASFSLSATNACGENAPNPVPPTIDSVTWETTTSPNGHKVSHNNPPHTVTLPYSVIQNDILGPVDPNGVFITLAVVAEGPGTLGIGFSYNATGWTVTAVETAPGAWTVTVTDTHSSATAIPNDITVHVSNDWGTANFTFSVIDIFS